MDPQSRAPHRLRNLCAACALFLLMLVLPGMSGVIVTDLLMRFLYAFLGLSTTEELLRFIADHANLVVALAYVLMGIPIAGWAWWLVRRARSRTPSVPAPIEAPLPLSQSTSEGVPSTPVEAGAGTSVDASSRTLPVAGSPDAPALTTPAAPAGLETCEAVPAEGSGTEPFEADVHGDEGARTGLGSLATPSFRMDWLRCRSVLYLCLLALGVLFTSDIVFAFFAALDPGALADYTELTEEAGLTSYGIAWLFSTIVLPPLVEEVAFRGIGLGHLTRAGLPFWAANIAQALAFALFHGNIVQGCYTFLVGLALGSVTRSYGSIVPAMLLHALYNLMGTVGVLPLFWSMMQLSDGAYITFGLVALIGGLILIKRDGARLQHKEGTD